jgi:hypothetical protein
MATHGHLAGQPCAAYSAILLGETAEMLLQTQPLVLPANGAALQSYVNI